MLLLALGWRVVSCRDVTLGWRCISGVGGGVAVGVYVCGVVVAGVGVCFGLLSLGLCLVVLLLSRLWVFL